MTTNYEPDGQTPPEAEYVLPQDVVDLVVVETVNNPLVTAADNLAWLLKGRRQASALSFGAAGDSNGSTGNGTDNTAALNNALVWLAANGKGVLTIPTGVYRITGPLISTVALSMVAVGGEVVILMDHPTADTISLLNGGAREQIAYSGIRFEAAQSNTGTVIKCDLFFGGTLYLLNCKANQSASLLLGQFLTSPSANANFYLDAPWVNSFYTSGYSFSVTNKLVFTGKGRVAMALLATSDLINAGELLINGAYFKSVISGVGGRAFVYCGTGSVVQIVNAILDVTNGADETTYGVRLDGGKLLTRNIETRGAAYLYKFVSKLADGSDLQLRPNTLMVGSSETQIADGIASLRITVALSVAPVVKLPNTLCSGQPLEVFLFNGGGSTWSGSVDWQKHDGTQALTEDVANFAGLEVGQTYSLSFRVNEIAGGLYWMQCGARALLE